MRPSLTLLPLLIATAPFAVANNNTGPGSVVINEIRIDQPGLDDDEYFELAGTPGTSLAGMWYVTIGDGAGGSGTVERAYDLSAFSIQPSGYFVMGHVTMTVGVADAPLPNTSNAFENNDNQTHMLVTNFTGASGDDIDTNDDGVIDNVLWTTIIDDVTVQGNEDEQGDLTYSNNIVYAFGFGANNDANLGKVERCPDTTGPFVGGELEHTLLEDTPGAANLCPAPAHDDCNDPGLNDAVEDAIPSVGSFVFDNTNGTSSSMGGGTCSTTMFRDVFYTWVAPSDGDYIFSTCPSPFNTRLALHLGTDCSATCLGENDDSCGVQSSVTLTGVLASTVVLIQIGGATDADHGQGRCDITQTGLPPANDDCATATAIAGAGVFPYDRGTATTSGFNGGDPVLCAGAQGFSGPHKDIFFAWTATAAGTFEFSNCGEGGDTQMNVHTGGDCSALCLSANDDGPACGLEESTLGVTGVSVSDVFLVQIGDWSTTGTSSFGNLTVTALANPPAESDCSSPVAIAGEGLFPFDTTNAITSNFNGGDPVNCEGALNNAGPQYDVFFVWTPPCDGDYLFTTCGQALSNAEFAIHLGSDCNATCLGNEGDNDGSCGGATFDDFQHTELGVQAANSYLLQIGGWTGSTGAGNLDISNVSGGCGPGGGTITVECDPAANHFLGNYAKLDTSSFGSGLGSDLHLECTDGPAGEFGFVLVAGAGTPGIPVFNGVLCLGSPQGRYNPAIATNQGNPALNSIGQFDGAGTLQSLFGNATSSGGSGYDVPSALPFSPPGMTILPASTWYFQVWFRDQIAMPGDTANFSNMIKVDFP